jgi:hypothetical protein
MENTEKEISFNAKQVMGLLEQAELGCHALFELRTIRRALAHATMGDMALDDPTVEIVQKAIVQLGGMESVIDQRAFINKLPINVQNLLVRLYFRFLDQFMQRQTVTLH